MSKTLDILKSVGAIIRDDHIVLTSGKHSDSYIRKDKLYPHTEKLSEICKYIASDITNLDIDVVVAPAVAGIPMTQWVAYHLTKLTDKEVLSIFTEKDSSDKSMFKKKQIFKRGYDKLVKEKNVLVVEDLTTTGGSVKSVVDATKAAGGNVVCVYVIVNRNPKEVNSDFMGAEFRALDTLEIPAYEESECPMCKENRPINTEIGHGKEYLENKNN